jgi:hypothetical protein
MGPRWVSNAAGTTTTSVFVTIGGAFGPGFVVAAEGRATEAGLVAGAVVAAGLAAGLLADLAAGFAAGFAAGLAALAAALVVAGRVAFGVLGRLAVRLGAAVDRRRFGPDPVRFDPVDVSSAIAFSSGVSLTHCPPAPTRSCMDRLLTPR